MQGTTIGAKIMTSMPFALLLNLEARSRQTFNVELTEKDEHDDEGQRGDHETREERPPVYQSRTADALRKLIDAHGNDLLVLVVDYNEGPQKRVPCVNEVDSCQRRNPRQRQRHG